MLKTVVAVAIATALLAAATAGAAGLLTGGDIKNSSLTGKDVRNRSLTKKDIRGFPQPQTLNRLDKVSSSATYGPGAIEILTATCPPGEAVVSGGWTIIGGGTIPWIDKSYDDTSWSVGVDNFDSSISADADVDAYCAPAGEAIAASASKRAHLIARDEAARRAVHK